LHALIEEADRDELKLSIHVESDSPARTLYDRLGFGPVSEHGVYVLMERAAVRAHDPSPSAV
jgi:hypothetical protein